MAITGLVGIQTTPPHHINVIDSLVSGVVVEVMQFGTQTDCIVGADDVNAQEVSTMFIPPQPGGEQMALSSTSIGDAPGGPGIAQVLIHYIDGAGNEQTEVVTLNGTAPVMTVATNIRFVNALHAYTPGVSDDRPDISADGIIRIYSAANPAKQYNTIPKGRSSDDSAQYMVPVTSVLAIEEYEFSATKKPVEISLRTSDDDGLFRFYGMWFCRKTATLNNSTISKTNLADPIFISPLSIVKSTAWSKEPGADVNVSWSGVLIPLARL